MIYTPPIASAFKAQRARSGTGTDPFWSDGRSELAWDSLHQHLNADVCVVGGGIAGLTTAYFLARAGRDVVVLDAGAGETRRSTGHLTCALDDRLTHIEQLHGTDALRLAVRAHQAAIDVIERLIDDEHIACDFERVDGYILAEEPDGAAILEAELRAAHRAGVLEAHIQHAGVDRTEGSALRLPNQAQVNPLAYLQGLARAVRARGGRIYHARAVEVAGEREREVRTSSGFRVTCEHVVVATHAPITDRFGLHQKQVPLRTYVIAATIPRGLVPHALYWDTASPYHYVRVARTQDPETEVLIVGGEDHRTGEPDEGEARFERIEGWMRERFVGVGAVRWRWSGQIVQPLDHLAFIGRDLTDASGAFVLTGDGGNGMTYGTLGARLIADEIAGASPEWGRVFDPRRRSLKAVGRIAREGLHTVAQYRSLVSPGDVASRDHIPPGCGAVVRDGLTKTAVYRDPEGFTHELSAICPHSGCVVQWNQTELSWDCPCHGSRYGIDGQVLNGPGVTPLEARGSTEIPLLHPFRYERIEQYAFRMVPSFGELR